MFVALLSIILLIKGYSFYNKNKRNYTIKEGTHGPRFDFALHCGIRKMSFKALFDKSCIYDKIDKEDDLNKLRGFSYGRHHKNSVRIGWKPSRIIPYKIEIWSYMYINGKRKYEHIVDVDVNTLVNYSITWADENIVIIVRDALQCSKVYKTPAPVPKFKFGYHMFPFFGGNAPAPHDMRIKIKR